MGSDNLADWASAPLVFSMAASALAPKAGGMWVLDQENYFDKFFALTHDRYDPVPVEAALKHLSSCRTALDGGAHYGTVTRQIHERFDRIVAFEPNRESYECLLRNTEHLTNVECHHEALGDAPGSISVGIAPENLQYMGTEHE